MSFSTPFKSKKKKFEKRGRLFLRRSDGHQERECHCINSNYFFGNGQDSQSKHYLHCRPMLRYPFISIANNDRLCTVTLHHFSSLVVLEVVEHHALASIETQKNGEKGKKRSKSCAAHGSVNRINASAAKTQARNQTQVLTRVKKKKDKRKETSN